MRLSKILIASMAMGATLLVAGPAPVTDNVPVIANVMPECEFQNNQSTAPELNFGEYYAYTTGDMSATTSIHFRCIENTEYEVAITSDNGDKLLNGSSVLTYAWDASGDMGGTSDSSVALREVVLAGTLPGNGGQILDGLTTGEHRDNLVVTINY